jgi:hypothetical protein
LSGIMKVCKAIALVFFTTLSLLLKAQDIYYDSSGNLQIQQADTTSFYINDNGDTVYVSAENPESENEENTIYEAKPDEDYLQENHNKKRLDKKSWKEITKGVSFDEKSDVVKEEPKEQSPPFQFSSTAARIVLFIIIILIIGFLIYRLVVSQDGLFNKRIKKKDAVAIEEIPDEDDPFAIDLETILKTLLKERKYREATRIYYLMVIRRLTENQLISWKKDKTNREYLQEMSRSENYSVFRQLTYAYEMIWYGEKNMDDLSFQPIFQKFDSFLQTVSGGNRS